MMTSSDSAPYESPFVVTVDAAVEPRRLDDFDLYAPFSVEPAPCVVFVHGPVGADKPRPRDWPVYQGYGQLAAQSGLVAVVADLDFEDWRASELPTQALRTLVERVRQHEVVDRERLALWAFSAGALLVSPWLSAPPRWLRCVALTYPVIAPIQRVDVSLVVTQVEHEQPEIQAVVDHLVMQAAGPLEVITVAGGRHGFDFLDPRAESEDAVIQALSFVQRSLRA